ncbi:MAG: hypothetical protein IK020_00180 [Clostridiales bacterium]|nr:hypothetical protein [Clostridiales bacterium]
MRKIACILAAILLLPATVSCRKKEKQVARRIAEDTPWWNETVTTVTPDEIKASEQGDFINVSVSCTLSDETAVIVRFSLRSEDGRDVSILRRYSYEGDLLGQVVLNDYLSSDEFVFEGNMFILGEKYYARIKTYDAQMESYVEQAYAVDFENGALKEPFALNTPILDGDYFSGVLGLVGVGDSIVYLIANAGEDRVSYQIFADDGSGLRKFVPDFGRDSSINSISGFRNYGDKITFTAEVLENSVVKSWYCTLDVKSFEMQKTELKNIEDSTHVYFLRDGSALTCDGHSVIKCDPATGESSEFLRFSDTYVFDDYTGADILFASDDEVVIYQSVQDPFGMNATTRIIRLKKADKNPNAGRQMLTLAYFSRLDPTENKAVNDFNIHSVEYFVEATDKYYLIAEASYDETTGESFMAQTLSGQVNAMDLLISDIRSGTGPDLVIYDTEYEKLNNTEYLIDLTKRVEAEEILHNGDYMDFVLSPNGRDGKHYRLNYKYMFSGFCVNKAFLEDGEKGLTYEQYDRIIADRNLGKSVLPEDDLSLMTEFLKTSQCFSYDEKGKFSLNNETFRKMAEYIASIPESIAYDDGMQNLTNVLMFPCMVAREFTDVYGYLYKTHTIIGMPSSDGHAEAIFGTGIGITSCSPSQDGAWEFAMSLLSSDAQRALEYEDPVMKSVQKEKLLGYVHGHNIQEQWMYGSDILPDEVADWYIGQLSDAVVVPDTNPKIFSIICEEMPAYFEGDKTLDEVIAIIENRVNLMIREQD